MASFTAIVEIPKGCDRRIHLSFDKAKFIDLGPIKEQIPINNGVMPIDYGFLKYTYNQADNDEVDALILTDQKLETGQEVEVEPLALLNRTDGDHKVLVRDQRSQSYKSWAEIPKHERELILAYFSYHHEISVNEDKLEAKKFIQASIKEASFTS